MSRQIKQFYEFGPFRIDPTERVLFREGKPVLLPPKIFETLLALVERSGQIVDKDKLIEEVWPDAFVEENNLTQNISALRKTLGDGRHEQRYIETIPRRGYRFAAQVREVRDDAAELIIRDQTKVTLKISEETEEIEQEQTAHATQASGSFFRHRKLRRAIPVAMILVIALVGVIFWLSIDTKPAETGAGQTPFRGSIAVLPFKALDANEREEYLGLGMADTLITKLSNIGQIKVRPTSAVRKYANQEQDSLAAGREQKVDAVLEGSIQRVGDKMRVTVRLLNVSDGTPLWAYKCDEVCTDPFELQDSISEEVTGALMLKLTGQEKERLAKRHTESIEAYQAYMMGCYFWNRRTPGGHRKARQYFEQAIKLDSNYALAYSGLAGTHLMTAESELTLEQKERLALRAIEIEDRLAEPHAILGFINMFFRYNWAGAEQELKRAIELNPNYATAYQWYAIYLEIRGQLDEAEMQMRRALEIDPLSLAINADLGELLYYKRDYDAALAQCLKTLDMDPTFGFTHHYLEKIYVQKGMYREAADHYFKNVELANDPAYSARFVASLRRSYLRTGVRGLWQAHNNDEFAENLKKITPYRLATIYAWLGETDKALNCLERDGFHEVFAKVEPAYDSLRSDPRFKELLNRLGLAD
jgi:DNA-binding winged helix-turn-helix (wHTH) protein/TolB-like protein/Tfp pilus assembly protein PilF